MPWRRWLQLVSEGRSSCCGDFIVCVETHSATLGYLAANAAKATSRAAATHAATITIFATEYGAEPVT